jgi:hypothetical protein
VARLLVSTNDLPPRDAVGLESVLMIVATRPMAAALLVSAAANEDPLTAADGAMEDEVTQIVAGGVDQATVTRARTTAAAAEAKIATNATRGIAARSTAATTAAQRKRRGHRKPRSPVRQGTRSP